MIIPFLLALAALGAAAAEAAPPRETAAFGVELHAQPEVVRKFLSEQYKECTLDRNVYRGAAGEARQTSMLAINAGLASHDPVSLVPCTYTPAGKDFVDSIEARFAHPDVDRDRRLYSLIALREYPDAVYAQPPRVRAPFEDLRRRLFQTFGKPVDERRESTVSAAANRARSLRVAKSVKRDDYVVRYLWAADGRLSDVEDEGMACECNGPYVKAIIEISRSPSTVPPNQYYVVSLRLVVEDPDLRVLQEAWNAQWRKPAKP